MNRLAPRLLLASALLSLTGIAAAAGVKTLHAEYKGGQVKVTWTAPAGAQPAFYNLYYSQSTILGNNGEYDDFEKIDGGKTEFQMTRTAKGELYIAVLPVDADGEETASFTEEVRLALTEGASANAGGTPAVAVAQAAGTTLLTLEKAQSDSATGILLTFSHATTVPAAQAKTAFTVEDASGALIPLTRLTIRDKTVLLHTMGQKRGATYIVRIQPVVTGKDATGKVINLDPLRSSVTFTATEGSLAPIVAPIKQPVQQAKSSTRSVLPATVTQPVPATSVPAKGLPSSGLGIVSILGASGAIMGWRKMRRK